MKKYMVFRTNSTKCIVPYNYKILSKREAIDLYNDLVIFYPHDNFVVFKIIEDNFDWKLW